MSPTSEAPGLEVLMRGAMDAAKQTLPPDVGVTMFCFHYGPGGYIAYGSTAERATMVESIVEWLQRWGSESPENTKTLRVAFERHFLGPAPDREGASQ